MNKPARSSARAYLGIECGATRSVALVVDDCGKCRRRVEAGPANVRLLSEKELRAHFRALAGALPRPDALGIGMAGVIDEAERRRVRAAAGLAWPGIPCWAGNDLQSALAAAERPEENSFRVRVIIICGTGSSCYGERVDGTGVLVGGWGHLLGDRGSAYDIALRALQAAMRGYDRDGCWPDLGKRLVRRLRVKLPNELVTWIQAAGKNEIAGLAPQVFGAAAAGDGTAQLVLAAAAGGLAEDAVACARRLHGRAGAIHFVYTGSVLMRQPSFAALLRKRIRAAFPRALLTPLEREGAWGAVVKARAEWERRGVAWHGA